MTPSAAQNAVQKNQVSAFFINTLKVLLVMIVTLMALGAGVRTMNAGLSCPDWPLCFGKVIPDFHPGVYFEFIHRAYAGLVAIVFFGCFLYSFFSKAVTSVTRKAAVFGLIFLLLQILAGAATVLWLVKWAAVTSHLMLATFFFSSVLWMLFSVQPKVEKTKSEVPPSLALFAYLMPFALLVQIFIGGAVASTYAGSVCVDWPLCNGQWVPTWTGAIGLQIIHRFVAYALGVILLGFAFFMYLKRKAAWTSPQLVRLSQWLGVIVLAQIVVGIANLLFYIPPALAVLHQSVGILLVAFSWRFFFVVRALRQEQSATAVQAKETLVGQAFGGVSG